MDANGLYYNISVSGFAPGEHADLVDLMDSMANGVRYLLLLRDANRIMRLVGSPALAMEFSASYNSGAQKSELKGFSYKFTGSCLYRAPVYDV